MGSAGTAPLRSESLLIGCQVLLGPLVGLQGFDGVDVLRQLRLPPHQDLVLLQILQALQEVETVSGSPDQQTWL